MRIRLLVVSALVAAFGSASAIEYILTDLGTLPGRDSALGFGLSSAGHATGYGFQSPSGTIRAFRWTSGSGMLDLGTLGGASAGRDVNGAGVYVGESEVGGFDRAFRWTSGGGMVSLGTLGGNISRATGVNEGGMIVGTSQTAGQAFRAFRWTEGGGMVNLGTLGGISIAEDVNNNNMVVGGSDLDTGFRRAFRWTQGGGMENLGTLGGDVASGAYAANDGGWVVGYSTPTGSTYKAFLYKPGQGMTELGGLFNYDNRPWDVNNDGDVVGRSWLSSNGNTSQAVIWYGGGAVQNLNDLVVNLGGWQLMQAQAINDAGQIVGYGVVDGKTHAYILDPVPEPGTLIAFGALSLGLLRRRRRR